MTILTKFVIQLTCFETFIIAFICDHFMHCKHGVCIQRGFLTNYFVCDKSMNRLAFPAKVKGLK